MAILIGLFVLLVVVIIAYFIGTGLGIIAGVGSVLISPPPGTRGYERRQARLAHENNPYRYTGPKLSKYDARYQSHEYKPPRG